MTTQQYYRMMFGSSWIALKICTRWAAKGAVEVTNFGKTQGAAAYALATSQEAIEFYNTVYQFFLLTVIAVIAALQFANQVRVSVQSQLDQFVERCLEEPGNGMDDKDGLDGVQSIEAVSRVAAQRAEMAGTRIVALVESARAYIRASASTSKKLVHERLQVANVGVCEALAPLPWADGVRKDFQRIRV